MSTISLFTLNAQTLSSLQVAIKNVSDNVAHAQDPDFNRRDSVFNNTNGLAVQIDVKRAVNTDLLNQLLDANSNLNSSDESQRIFQNMAGLVGVSNNNLGYIQDKLADVQTAWNNFEAAPDSAATEAAVIQASDSFAGEIRRQFSQIRSFESQESANVQVDVTALNTKLRELQAANIDAIGQNGSPSGVSATTQDKIDSLVKDISQYVSVVTITRANGSVSVFTKDGIPLVDKQANQFAWDASNRNVYTLGGTVPGSFNGAGSLNTSFSTGKIGAKVQALDPTSPPTAGTSAQVGVFQKYRAQLAAFVDMFSTTSTSVAGTNTAYDAAFITSPADRATDIVQTTPAPTAPLTQGTGFFVTTSAPGTVDEESFAVNANLLNGTRTVNRQAAPNIISFFTSQKIYLGTTAPAGSTNVGGTTPLGGLTLSARTPQGIISGITQFFAASQASVQATDATRTSIQQDLTNRLAARVSVNTDDELARLQVLQNLYAATGRLMSTADTLFQTLLGIGR
jgi:flagellar hook-associated protein 1 FlgK